MRHKICGLLAMFVSLLVVSAHAQLTPTVITDTNRTGDLPFAATIGSDIEHVDLSSGNLVVKIPVVDLPGRGMPFDFLFHYNANFWQVASYVDIHGNTIYFWELEARPYMNIALGWEISAGNLTSATEKILCNGNNDLYMDHYMYEDSTGAKHLFAAQNASAAPCTGSDPQGPDLASQGMWINTTGASALVYSADGTQLWGTQTDRNGNRKTEGVSGVDTLGRTIVTMQTGTNQFTYTVYDATGTAQHYVVNMGTPLSLQTAFGVSAIQEYSGTQPVISSIVLPNGQQYGFKYDPNYGYLTEVDLPTGAVITYAWQNVGSFVPLGGLYPQRVIQSRTVNVNGQTWPWTFSGFPLTVTVTDPLNNQATYASAMGTLLNASFYNGTAAGNPLRQYTMTYANDTCPYKGSAGPPKAPGCGDTYIGNRLTSVTTTLDDGRVNKKVFVYDSLAYSYHTNPGDPNDGINYTTSRGDVTESQEYDYGSTPSSYGNGVAGSLLRRTDKTYLNDPISNPSGYQNYVSRNIVDKVLQDTTYDNAANTCQGASQPCAQTQYEYDNYVTGVNALISTSSSAPQHDYTNYSSSFTYRGNVTRVKRLRTSDGTLFTTIYTYDDLGNIRAIKDPIGNSTSYDYTDRWSGTACLPPSNSQAYVTTVTNALGQLTKAKYFPCRGLLEAQQDQNDINASSAGTTYVYNDPLARLKQKNFPDGGQVTNTYNDVPPVSVTTSTAITSSLNLISVAIADGLGRTTQTQLTSDPDGTTYVDTTYDGLGRKSTVSNPHRTGSSTTDGTTTYGYDVLSRVTSVLEQDGSQVLTNYASNCTTATDETGKARKSCVDGLGRMTEVLEDPGTSPHLNYETDYQYDALGDLLTVNQKGGSTNSANWRTRTFTYNSLAQLVTAKNPESGTINYTYDADGNLLSKVAPLPNQIGTSTVTTNYTYDALNRLTGKSYVGMTTAPAKVGYDGVALTGCTTPPPADTDSDPIGYRTSMCDGSGGTSWVHDPMGRVTQERRIIGSAAAKYVNYTYNLDGSLFKLTTPPLKTIVYTQGRAGRTLSVVDSTDNINFVTSATYAPPGELATMVNGLASPFAGFTTNNAYNKRLQLVLLSTTINAGATTVFSLCFDFHLGVAIGPPCSFSASTLGDNGNVIQIVNKRDNTRTANFMYDSLNRIQQAYSTGTQWGETFSPSATSPGVAPTTSGIDGWANLTNKSGVTGKTMSEGLSCSANTSNQLNSCYSYDAAGNMTQNGSTTYTYDAENRLTNTAGYTYVYDGNGERVEKCNITPCPTSGTSGTLYWKGTGSETLDESDLSGNALEEYIFFNGHRIARRDVSTNLMHYYFSDHLGSHGVVESATGTTCEQDIDYYPYGGVEHDYCPNAPQNYKFTGKERDAESGLDNFGARYNASTMGRFMSPDPKILSIRHIINPQKWNKYAYVLNNPLALVDPNGMEEVTIQVNAMIQKANVGYGSLSFRGDNRGFSSDMKTGAEHSRVSVTMRIETDPAKNHGNPLIGKPEVNVGPTHFNLTGGEKTSTGPKMPEVTATQDKNGNVNVNLQESMRNPYTPPGTGSINADLNISVNQNATNAEVSGGISASPSWEANFSVDGGSSLNVPLQTEPSSTAGFGLGLQQTNNVDQKVDLPPPSKEEDPQ